MTRLNIPLFVALAASILTAIPANAGGNTLPHQRMIRRRGPGPIGGAPVAYDHGIYVRQGPEPTGTGTATATGGAPTSTAGGSTAASGTTRATNSAPAATTTSSAVVTSSAAPSSAATTTSGGLLDSLTGLLGSSSTTTLTSTTPTTSSVPSTTTVPTTSQAPPTSAAPVTTTTPTINIATPSPSRNAGSTVVVVASTTLITPQESQSAAAAAKTRKITQNTIISLVVIAACIGGAIAIWTVIRKWKLSPSEKFDDRMQPIDWAPQPNGIPADETMEEKRHRRAGSAGSHGSFTSGGVGQSENGHAKGMYADSQQGHGYGMQPQDFPPPHDFTAGAAQPGYGQYYGNHQYAGGNGYADLQRGPSVSESTYSHGSGLQRGLSYSRGPVGGYEAQPGAGGVPPLPNPYGGEYGYDDYAPQPQVQAQGQQHQGQAPYRGYN